MAVELSSLIRTELQVDLPIRAFIEDPSSLAALLIDQLIPGSSKADVVVNVVDLNAEAVLDPAICLALHILSRLPNQLPSS